jgi:co-chaperonin GroES (HSP10)
MKTLPKPIKNFILIDQAEKKSKFNLSMAGNESDRKLETAKVLAVGPDVEYIVTGDTVIFKSYNLFVVSLEDKKELCFLSEDETLAIL